MQSIQRLLLACGLVFSLMQSAAVAAQKPSPPATQSQSASSDPEVSATQPVITIHGLCGGASKRPKELSSCSKVINREQFEKLMNALNPGGQKISPGGRQNLAQAYVEALAFEQAARNAGMEETADYREVMNWVRLRTAADLYRRSLEEEYRNPSQAEIDAYYRKQLASFERVKLQRILIPREKFSVGDSHDFDQKAMAEARSARHRAASGEDFERIQADVYAHLGLGTAPATDLGSYGRADFIEKEGAEVFSLQPGEISQLETEIKSYVIYKVAGRYTLAENQVKSEIARDIAQQKYKDAVQAVMDSAKTEFNEQYFGKMAPQLPANVPMPRRPEH
jgi:hypothetical protein